MQVPDLCRPDPTVMQGYSGGMALYVANWESVLLLFEYTNIFLIAYNTVIINKYLN